MDSSTNTHKKRLGSMEPNKPMPTVPLLIVSASPHRGRNTGGYLVNYYHQKSRTA